MDDAMETPEQVEKTLQLPVLASVPEFQGPAMKI
jgi:capsular polysaccharide biosynthesis protein